MSEIRPHCTEEGVHVVVGRVETMSTCGLHLVVNQIAKVRVDHHITHPGVGAIMQALRYLLFFPHLGMVDTLQGLIDRIHTMGLHIDVGRQIAVDFVDPLGLQQTLVLIRFVVQMRIV